MLRGCALLAVCLTLSFLSCEATAGFIKYTFTGTVNDVGQPVFGIQPPLGSPVTGSFSYDSSLPPGVSDPGLAIYFVQGPFRFVADIDGATIESSGLLTVTIQNDPGGLDTFEISTESVVVNGTPIPDSVLDLTLFSILNPFANTDLPGHLRLEDFNRQRVGLLMNEANSDQVVEFSIDSINQVPAPKTWALLLVGLGGFAAVARRERNV